MALIDRDAAIKTVCEKEGCGETCDLKCLPIRAILELPEVNANTVVHGEWEKSKYFGFLCCSVCHDCYVDEEWVADGRWNFCPNCGAKMG